MTERGHVSQRAVGAALHRAAHQWLDEEPKIIADAVIGGLLEPEAPDSYAELQARAGKPFVDAMRALFVLRQRFTEDELAAAAARGVQQYVVLGAGLDTFAFRQPPFATKLKIFEVDQADTQAWKRARLAAVGYLEPRNLCWVPADFERDSLRGLLIACGFNEGRPAFFSWLGVIPYLSWPAIEAVLRFVSSLPTPSGVVFDFVLPDDDLEGLDREISRAAVNRAAAMGEPFLTRIRGEEWKARLHGAGFSEVFFLTPSEASTRYFAGRRDGLRPPAWDPLLTASV